MGSLRYCNILCYFSKNVLNPSRHFSISSKNQAANKTLSKQGKLFNKIIEGTSRKKRKFVFDNSQVPSSGSKLNLGQHIKQNKENNRRLAVLNSVFMKHISDLLVTGNIGVDVLNKGLEISRVSMNSNFNQLNVFWGTRSEENVLELESVLPSVGYALRHELSQLRVIGVVPRVLFIKDKNFSNGAKVDYLLRIADFGEDHVPTELGSDFKDVSLTSPDKNKSLSHEQSASEMSTVEEEEEVMPAMRHDVFNLDHQRIMNKILKKMQKSRAFHRFEPNLAIKTDGSSVSPANISEVENMTKEDRKEALAKFILSRRILQEKMKQNKHKSDKEVSMSEDFNSEDDVDEDFEAGDYIEEDVEENKCQN